MPDFTEFKIPIVATINDSPKPPNFENNRRGPNGSYYTERYNALIDALTFDPTRWTKVKLYGVFNPQCSLDESIYISHPRKERKN